MNEGTTGQSGDDQALFNDSMELFKDYYSTQMPAMGYMVRAAAGTPAKSQMAADQASGSVRTAEANTLPAVENRSSNIGSGPGTGNFAGKVGAIMDRGANTAGVNSGVARVGPQVASNNIISGAVQAGEGSIRNALSSLGTEAGIQDANMEADAANKAGFTQQLTGLGLSAGLAAIAA